MDTERLDAIHKLRAVAEVIVARPEKAATLILGLGRGHLDFSLIHRPAFRNHTAFAVLRSEVHGANVTRRICRVLWEQPKDLELLNAMPPVALKLRPPAPTIDVRAIDAPATVGDWLEEAARLRIPPGNNSGAFGTDGESTTVQFGEGFHHSTFSWWCDGPTEWAPLVEWAARVLDGMSALFPPLEGN